jgi:hypothetical protein
VYTDATASDRPLLASHENLQRVVLAGVYLGGFAGVMHGVQMVAVAGVRVMSGCFVSAVVVMFRRLSVMVSCEFVILGGLPVMHCCFLRHLVSSTA